MLDKELLQQSLALIRACALDFSSYCRVRWSVTWLLPVSIVGCSLAIGTDHLVDAKDSGASGGGSGLSGGTGGGTGSGSGSGGVTSDTGVPDAAGGDSGESDSPPPPFCASLTPAPTLCSDFDEVDLPAGWEGITQWGDCGLVVDDQAYASPSRSISFTTLALADTEQCAASLDRTLAEPTTSLSIDFDILPQQLFDSEWLLLVLVQLDGVDGVDELHLRIRETYGDVAEDVTYPDGGKAYSNHPLPDVPPVGQWSHIRWELTFTGTTALSSATVNGKTTGDTILSKGFLGPAKVKLGFVGVSGVSGPWAARIDNIVINVL
jgi:hypothetical protein